MVDIGNNRQFFEILFYLVNTHFTDMHQGDQKVSKVPKETFSNLRINIGLVYDTLGNLQLLQIIVIFCKISISPCKDSPLFRSPGEK